MPTLKNAKHELFAQELARGSSATAAYKAAGFRGGRTAASRLLSNVDIQARVAELQGASAERTELTVENLLLRAADLEQRASAAMQFSAAIGALKLQAVIAGLYVEKRDNTNTNKIVRELTDEEIAARLAELHRGRASNGDGHSQISQAKPH